jgi:hypothetical protein
MPRLLDIVQLDNLSNLLQREYCSTPMDRIEVLLTSKIHSVSLKGRECN